MIVMIVIIVKILWEYYDMTSHSIEARKPDLIVV